MPEDKKKDKKNKDDSDREDDKQSDRDDKKHDNRNDRDDKDDDDKRKEQGHDKDKDHDKEDKKEEQKPKKPKKNEEKMIKEIEERLGKFDKHMEKTDKKLSKNVKNRKEERKQLLGEIQTMHKEIDPYLEKDKEILQAKVKEEVENALLVIMDKKIKAETEVEELKKLLKERNARIYELEEENRRLKGHTSNMHQIALKSQDAEVFERAIDEPVYDQPPSQDEEDDFWQEGKPVKAEYDNSLWIMGNKDALPASNLNAYNAPSGIGGKAQPPGYGKSLPKRPQGYDPNDDMGFYGVGVKGGGRKV